MPSIPWKYICIYFLFRAYGPEIPSQTIADYSKSFSEEYCKDHENKDECIVEQVKSLLLLANDTYHAFFANLTKYIEGSDIKHTVKKFLGLNEKETSELFANPTPSKERVNVSTAMSTILDQMQQKLGKTDVGDSIKEVRKRLKTIATDKRHVEGLCTLKIGIDSLVVLKMINQVAELTNMPQRLQNVLENTVKVKDADSSMVKNEQFAFNGLVYYILIATYRHANDSFDFGLAVYHAEYQISPMGFQRDADQEIVKRLIRFLNPDADDAEGKTTWEGYDDLNAYFYDEAFKMFMRECPALLTGFKKVRNDIRSIN